MSCPMCPGWPPGLRPLFFRGEQRRRCLPSNPSEEGGLEEVVEFRLRTASWRSKSAIRLVGNGFVEFFPRLLHLPL